MAYLGHRDVGDIAHPDVVGALDGKILEQIRIDPVRLPRSGRDGLGLAVEKEWM